MGKMEEPRSPVKKGAILATLAAGCSTTSQRAFSGSLVEFGETAQSGFCGGAEEMVAR